MIFNHKNAKTMKSLMDGSESEMLRIYTKLKDEKLRIVSSIIEFNLLENKMIELDADGYAKLTKEGLDYINECKTKNWCVEKFGINPDDFVWYNSGFNYDRIGVKTKEAADKVTAKVAGKFVESGMLAGMPLGGQSHHNAGKPDECFDVTC